MTTVGMDLRGEKELIKALKGLPGSVNRRVIKGATRKAMKPVVKTAKDKLRPFDRTGQLRKSIGTRQKKYPAGIMWTGVGPRKGFKISAEVETSRGGLLGLLGGKKTTEVVQVNPVNYAHLVEYGFHNKRAKKQIKARPFLRPALDQNRGRVQSILTKELKVGIAKEAAKARRKAGGPK